MITEQTLKPIKPQPMETLQVIPLDLATIKGGYMWAIS